MTLVAKHDGTKRTAVSLMSPVSADLEFSDKSLKQGLQGREHTSLASLRPVEGSGEVWGCANHCGGDTDKKCEPWRSGSILSRVNPQLSSRCSHVLMSMPESCLLSSSYRPQGSQAHQG